MSRIDNNIINHIEAGLKAEHLKQELIANNVANLQTRDYKTLDVRFEELFQKAMKSGKKFDIQQLKSEIYAPETTTVKSNGNDVSLENEIGKMVQNTLRHKTYVRLLSKKYQQMQMAIDTTR